MFQHFLHDVYKLLVLQMSQNKDTRLSQNWAEWWLSQFLSYICSPKQNKSLPKRDLGKDFHDKILSLHWCRQASWPEEIQSLHGNYPFEN